MVRGLFATIVAVSLVAVVFATAAVAGPPTSGITVNCTVGGKTTVSNFKGNPSQVELTRTDISPPTFSTAIGGKYKHLFSVDTPKNLPFLGEVEVWIWYGKSATPVWYSGSIGCVG